MDNKRAERIKDLLGGTEPCRLCGGPRGALKGARLRALREEREYGLSELARHIGISAAYLSDMELGKRSLGVKVADRLLKGLGL